MFPGKKRLPKGRLGETLFSGGDNVWVRCKGGSKKKGLIRLNREEAANMLHC